MIEIRNLKYRYGKTTPVVLNGANAFFEKGEISVLLGLNGSGKTTLIKLLAGLYRPDEGQIMYAGHPAEGMSIKERSRKIAYVAQQFGRIDDFTVLDYMLFSAANRVKVYELPSEEEISLVNETAKRFGVFLLLDKKLGEISGGERQIVSIAAAVVQKTDVILLDEPTSALDICNQYKVLAVLKELAESEKKTIILSSHNPNHALFLKATVFLLHNGIIVDSGGASEIVVPDRLRQVYGDRVEYSKNLEYNEISFQC
ncbi:MAG: ABC transporter ATP-binding protein [Clostridia bacterium]|nr:ABC transporter ATP-binding protein [Clostridia bacterium]